MVAGSVRLGTRRGPSADEVDAAIAEATAQSGEFPYIYLGDMAAQSATVGTDTAASAGTLYYGSAEVGSDADLHGLRYLIGSVGGTNKVIAYLWNHLGVVVAQSALTGLTVGTLATYQDVAFTATYRALGPGLYFAGLQFDGSTSRFRTHTFGAHPTGTKAGVFGTPDSITPPTTFVAQRCPFAMLY